MISKSQSKESIVAGGNELTALDDCANIVSLATFCGQESEKLAQIDNRLT